MNKDGKSILFFGGAFDPIHNGHLIVAREVAEQKGLQNVIFVPNGHPPHKTDHKIVPGTVRYEMLKEINHEDRLFNVSDVELSENSSKKMYTIDTVRHLKETMKLEQINWLIGADQASLLHTWRNYMDLINECNLIIVKRPGYEIKFNIEDKNVVEKLNQSIVPVTSIDISSTAIRKRVKNKLPISYYVPICIEEFIFQRDLYRT